MSTNNIPTDAKVANRMVRILGKGVTQANAPLCGTDALGNGVLVTHTRRAMVARFIVALFAAWFRRSPLHTAGAIGHGLRLVADPVSGNGSPCFVEAKGCVDGTLYLYKCSAKRDALLAAFAAKGISVVKADVEGGQKDGLRVTFAPDADADGVLDILCGVGGSYMTTGPSGWDAGALATSMRDHNNALHATPDAPPADASQGAQDDAQSIPQVTEGEQTPALMEAQPEGESIPQGSATDGEPTAEVSEKGSKADRRAARRKGREARAG